VITKPKKRELTPEEQADAERLAALWEAYKKAHPGATQVWLAQEAGIGKTQGAVWQYLSGTIPLNLKALLGLSMALEVPPSDISPTKAAILQKNSANVMRDLGVAGALSQVKDLKSYASSEDLPPGQFVFVPRIEVSLSAGAGREVWHVEEVEPLPFLADYIRRLAVKPKNAVLVQVSGPSMERTLFDGDTVIVDRADTTVADGRVYALYFEGELRIKRLYRKPGGGLLVVSDNAERFPALDISADDARHVEIIGRVRYRSGSADF
jgi:phage repressor protein C with HTH and peptisase S24 domain